MTASASWPLDGGVGPLAGVRVVELATFISGPFAAMMLGDLGADVVKVEPPREDPMRRFGRGAAGLSPIFVNLNRGKRSVTLDLKDERAQDQLRALLAVADILVCNWRPSVAARLGLADDVLTRINPRLVRVYVTGYGPDGPLAETPTFDSIVQARLGMTEGQADGGRPALATSYVVDKVTATMATQAALAAVVARDRTGIAERVDVAMLDAAAYLNFPDVMANRTLLDHQPDEARNRHAAATRPVEAADGWLVVVPVTAEQIRRACRAVGRPGLADELLAERDATRLTTRFFDEVEVTTRTGSVARWLAAFTEADVPAGPCLGLDGHLVDPQTLHNRIYDVVDGAGRGRVRRVRYPAVFSTWGRLRGRAASPGAGEHTDELVGAERRGDDRR